MSTITKCDKCNKIITKENEQLSLSFMSFLSRSEVKKQYNIPNGFSFCQKCSIPFAKYLSRYLKDKK